jgi:acyl carrier protein
MPPLAGVVHAAGVLRDHAFAGFPQDAFDDVLRTKVVGARVLDEELAGRPLDFFVCYSSAGALLGSVGQANHAAANGFLDGLCHARRRAGRPALTVNWGAWSEIGVASGAALAARLADRGMRRIAPEAGIAALESLLCEDVVQAAALPADWATYFQTELNPPRLIEGLRPARTPSAVRESVAQKPANLRERFDVTPEEQRRAFLVDAVCAEAARVLGARAPLPDDPLGDAGLDSLMAIELRGRLAAATGLSLPVTLQFNYPTPAAIAEYLLGQLQPAVPDDEAMLAEMLERELREIETI